MYRKFLNARSPLRLLEKGLHGGLGRGNLGAVVAAHGVGKTPFLVGVALDEMLRGGQVLHVAIEESLQHVRDHYDTVFADLANTSHLEHEAEVHADVDRHRSIRCYPREGFDVARLREAVHLEAEAGARPALIVLEGFDVSRRKEVEELKAFARELDVEVWLSVACEEERLDGIPRELEGVRDLVSVILALEPGDGVMHLRALKDHDNPDLSELHVALDPRTLLLVRA